MTSNLSNSRLMTLGILKSIISQHGFGRHQRQIVAKTIRIINPEYFGLCWFQFLQTLSGQTMSNTNMPRERTDIDYPAEECWQCCVWWRAGSSLRISGFVSWILSKSILDFNSREKAVAARVQKQSPSSFSGEISRRITLTSGEKSDIIIPSIYMKSHQLNCARIFCLSNQNCQLSGWTPVGNEI